MSKIEVITRLHSAKTVSIECASGSFGRAVLETDVLLGVLAIISRDYPLGTDAILARYLDDGEAAARCLDKLEALGADYPRPDLHPFFASQAIAVFCEKLLVSQQQRVKALYKRHGTYANRSKQRQKKFRLGLKRAEARGNEAEIARYQRMVVQERKALDDYAGRKAAATDVCPRCRGTGTVALHPCDDCAGTGHIQVKPSLLRTYIRNCGVEMSDKLFDELWRYFDACVNRLHSEAGEAARALARQLEKERQ